MRSSVLGLLLPLFLGCSGQNVVAGEEKTKAEQLEASVPSWCESTCTRLLACNSSTPCQCNGDVCDCVGVDANCPTQCKATFAGFTKAGEACAAIGERMQKCIDRLGCADLGGSDPCRPSAAERAECPDPNDSGDSSQPPTAVGPNTSYAGSANVGDTGYGGSANLPSATGGSSSYAGGAYGGSASTGGPAVSCSDSYGAGGGQPDNGSTSQVICEEGRDGCSDRHAYSWVCATDSQGHRACSCFVDRSVTGAFALGAACPAVAQVNAGCGWNLTE